MPDWSFTNNIWMKYLEGSSAMQVMKSVLFMLLLMLAAGCSGQRIRENMYKGVYDGSRIENMRGSTPAENAGKPDTSYDQYKQQREEQLKRNPP